MALSEQTGFFARNRWLLWTVVIVAAVVLLGAFASLRTDPVPIHAVRVERGSIRSIISTNGKVEPIENFEAHAPLATSVDEVFVKEGDQVKKGQLLVRLNDSEARDQAARAMAQIRAAQASNSAIERGGTQEEVLTLQADLVKARAQRDTAERNFQAFQRLQQTDAASPGEVRNAQDELSRADAELKLLEQKEKDRYSAPEVEQAKAQSAQAQAAYAAAEDVLSKLDIRAPFAGEVYSLPVQQGSWVNPGDLILQEADLSKIRIRAFVDEPDIGRLSVGDPMEITWDAVPGRVWQGVVGAIPSTIKMHGTRNVGETTCIVHNRDFKLLPNVNVGVSIVTAEHKDVLTLPREAVRVEGGQSYVLLVSGDQIKRQNVQTSISNLTQVEVTSGLSDNARVALASTNSKPLKDGLSIKVVQ
jgi:HlyD family secretion protein